MSENILVLNTVDTIAAAQKIARYLVEQKLAACVNIINNVTSVYSWENNIVEDAEIILVIKTKKVLYEKLENAIKNIHPYDVPEIISIEIDNGSYAYLDWLNSNTL